MTLVLNEEQRQLKDTARDFLNDTLPVSALRKLRDTREGFNPDHWRAMCELGWSGIALPEQYGGLEFGYMGLGAIFEQMGRNLSASPLLNTVVLGGTLIELLGSESQKTELLPAIISGELTLAVAIEEGHHHAPTAIHCQAKKTEQGFVLNGRKSFVNDGGSANQLIVLARSDENTKGQEGLSLFLLDKNTPG